MSQALKALRSMAPVKVDNMIDIANEYLQSRGALPISKRTLRYYTSRSVVPSPMGSPKFARYGYEHVLSLLGSRAMQDQGMKLEAIREELADLRKGRYDRVESVVDTWLSNLRGSQVLLAREGRSAYGEEGVDQFTQLAARGRAAIKVKLTEATSLEVTDTKAVVEELTAAKDAIDKLISAMR
jgi:DNA-binding transcriptional MerR regulator